MSFNQPIKPAKDIEGVRRSAFWHLGRRDHSETELREKLARKTDNQQWIDAVICECVEYNYLNDARFVENFIRYSQNKGFGINRIKRDLQRKGIVANEIDNAFESHQSNYVDSAVTLLAAKYTKRLGNHCSKQKAMAFLQAKGHCFDDIFTAIDRHNEEYPIDDCDYLSEAQVLLARKFKTEISEKKMHDKALRFLISRGYTFTDSANALRIHNEQIINSQN